MTRHDPLLQNHKKASPTQATQILINAKKVEEPVSHLSNLSIQMLISTALPPASTDCWHYPTFSFEPVCQQTTAERVFPNIL